ncbi:hypothetical protein M9H77_05304 [Catharanthus roseus]|uniref:Uncharacterized protein n=1 Tax=Catharanthus roseus TaxID=4058 RepID=A0ACC0CGQ5_CATRO|nr:hypothetical protein M9H77_05304 [Catharanthus roseus]
MAFMHSCIHISVDRCVDYFLFLLDCCMHFVVAVFLDCFILYKCPACDQNFSAFPRVTSMDHKKVSCLHFDLNSEPENSYYSEIDMSCPVDLNSGPESSYASSQNQQTNSYLPIDLNLLPEKSFLRYDINWVLEKVYRPSPNQQSNSSFRSKDDNQLFLSKKKRSQDAVEKKKDETIAKRLKADREKKRRDKLNGSFQELGDILDVDRHKNNKRDIIVEAIHVLKDLTSELNRQKVQHAALTEESREGYEVVNVGSHLHELELMPGSITKKKKASNQWCTMEALKIGALYASPLPPDVSLAAVPTGCMVTYYEKLNLSSRAQSSNCWSLEF